MSKRLHKAIYALGALAILLGLAYAILSSSWFNRWLERRIITSLENFTGGRVEIGQFRFRPIDLHMLLRNVVIHGTEPPGAPPLFSARVVVAQLSPALLLRRQLHLRRLDWDQAEIHIRTQPDGSTNLPGPVARFEGHEAFAQLVNLSIGTLTLARTSVFWNDERETFDLNARELAILLRSTRGRHYLGTLASSNLTFRSPRLASPPITFTSRFDLSRNDLAVTWLEWQTAGIKGRGTFDLRMEPKLEARFSFQADAELASLGRALKIPELQTGLVHAEGHGVYRAEGWSAQGRVQARDLTLHTLPINPGRLNASADFAVTRESAELSNLLLSAWQGTVRGSGEIRLTGPTPQFRFRTQLRDFDLATLLYAASPGETLLGALRPASRIGGTADTTWTGDGKDLRSEFKLQFAAPSLPPGGSLPVSGDVRGTARGTQGLILDLQDANLQTPKSSLSAHGELSLRVALTAPTDSLVVQWRTSDFEEWRPLAQALCQTPQAIPLALKSNATFSGEVLGTLQNPQIHGLLKVGEFEYHHWTWDRLAANLVAEPSFVEISAGHLEHETSSLDVEASAQLTRWRLTDASVVHVAAHARGTPLAGLKAALGMDFPVSGSLAGRLDLDGTVSDLGGKGTLRIEKGDIAGESFDSLSAQVGVAEATWHFEGIQLAKGSGRIVGQVSVSPARRSLTMQLQGSALALASLSHLHLTSPTSNRPLALHGEVKFDLRGEGTLDNMSFHSTFQAQGVSVGDSPLGDFQGQADGEGQRYRMQGDGSGPGGTLRWSGQGRMANDWPFELEGQYANFHVDPWIRNLVNGQFQAAVIAGGSFKLSGPLRDPQHLELRSQAQTLQISFPGLTWTNDQPIDLHYTQGVMTASRFRMRGPSTDLAVEGSVRWAEPAALSFNAQGSAEATLLALLDPALKATGRSEVELHLTGSPAQPLLNGRIDVHDISLAYGDLPFRLSSLNGTIQLAGERVVIQSLRGVSGGGEVTLGGFVTLAAMPRFNVQAKLTQVRVRYPADFTSILGGEIRLVGTSERAQLEGDLVVRQMFASENVNWLARLIAAGSPFGEATPGVASPLASKIRVNVRVTSAPPVRLESHDLRLVGDVDVRLQGTLANPVQVGTVHFLSGDAVFRGNRYKLTRGDIALTNPFRTQATLDLEAQTRVERYQLTLEISGPFDRLKFAYRSDPPLATEDILSLLALGYSAQQEAMPTQAGRTLTSVGASALLSEALSSQVSGRITRLFGVSRIKVDPNVGTSAYGTGARVTIEQQVTRDFTLTYVTNTAASQYRIIQFEWAIDNNISLMGIRDQNGIFGIELRFRHRFK